MLKTILRGTIVAGTLDIASAILFGTVLSGVPPIAIVQSVAAGPFGDGMYHAALAGVVAGLAVHYAIMAVMVSAFLAMSIRFPRIDHHPVRAGIGYGFLLYLFMYWIVLPYRWPSAFPQTAWWQIGNALFSHIICVGIPIAWIIAHRAENPSGERTAS